MGLISKMIKINIAVNASLAGVTLYYYPELRREPGQLFAAMMRGMRVGRAGTLMAMDYLRVCHIENNPLG